MRVTILGSGSRGNAILIDAGTTRLLVDVGFGPRALARRLAAVGCAPESIAAVVLTHEHVDHSSGALVACARWGWPLYATAGTLAALPVPTPPVATPHSATPLRLPVSVRAIEHGVPWSIGDVTGYSSPVPHDAADCAAVVLEERRNGARVGIALDLGHVPETLVGAFARLDLLVVEANHDVPLLTAGPYPWTLKQRILGLRGHLSNAEAAGFVAMCAHRGLRGVLLAHLSETNNAPELAVASVEAALRRRGTVGSVAKAAVVAATQRVPLGPISTRLRSTPAVGQLELSL